MGYRSDVKILIYGERDDVTAFVASEKLKGIPEGLSSHPLQEPERNGHERRQYDYYNGGWHTMLEFSWWDTKWYESYTDVSYWDNLASVFEEAFPRLSMEYVRVGESVDDNVTDYYGDDNNYYLNISREIINSAPEEDEDE